MENVVRREGRGVKGRVEERYFLAAVPAMFVCEVAK